MFDHLKHTYGVAAADKTPAEVEAIVTAALERADRKHTDFARFLLAVEYLASVFFCNHKEMPLDDYLETLYCAVKHGDFSRTWRVNLKRPAVPPPPVN